MGDKKRKLNRLQDAARNKIKSFLIKHGIPKPIIAPKTEMTNSLRLEENNFQIPKIKNADLCNNNINIQTKSFVASDDDYKLKSINEPAKIINKKKQKKQSKIVSSIETDFKLIPSSYDERLKKKYKILPSNNSSPKLKNGAPPQGKILKSEPPKIKKNKTQSQQNTKLKYGATTQEKLAQKRQLITKSNKSNKKKKFNEFTVTDIASNNNLLYNADSDSDADDYIEAFFNNEADDDNSSNYTNGIQNSDGNEQLISINPNIPNDCSVDYEMNNNNLVHYSNNSKSVSSDYDSADEDSTYDDSTVTSKDYSFDSYSSTDEFEVDAHEDLCDLLYEDYSDDSKDTDYKCDESLEDIYIKHGDAKIYDDAAENVEFDSDTTAIFEIPSKSNNIKTDSSERLSPICDRNKNFNSQETTQLPIIYNMKDDEKKSPLQLKLPNFAYTKKSKCQNITVNEITKNMQKNVSEIKKVYPKIDVPSPSSPSCTSPNVSPLSPSSSPSLSPLSSSSSSSSSPSSSSSLSLSFSSTSALSSSPLRSPQLASTNHTPEHKIDLLNIETNTEKLQYQSKSIFCNAINARQVLLLLKDKMYFHGSLKMKLLIGNIEIFGYKLNDVSNDYVTVYSPRGQSFLYLTPIIQTSMNADTTSATTNKLTNQLELLKKEFLNYELEFIQNEFNDETDAIILLERVENNPNINMIEKYMKQNVFPNINAFNCQSKCYSSEFILHSKFFVNATKGLKINTLEWNDLQISNNNKIFICGGKGVGKSTLLRYLVNSNLSKLSKFLIIDLDIGQPELFLPQTISATLLNEPILGPGYLKNISPEYSILFGNINVLISPLKYLKCVIELITLCNDNMEYKNIPWIINTMGYVRGIGTELIVSLIKIIKPTNVIQLNGEHIVNDNFDILLHSNDINSYQFKLCENEMKLFNDNHNNKNITVDYKLHLWNALKLEQRFTEWDITQRDLRYIMILSKLGNMFTGTDEWITDVKPYCTSLDEITVMIFNEDDGTISNLNTELIPDIINGNLVYLCQSTQSLLKEDNFIKCYGIGIVRIADRTSNTVYLLSSIPPNKLRHVNALAICNIPLLPSLLVNQSKNVEGTMPYLYKTDKFIGSKQIVQMSTYRPK